MSSFFSNKRVRKLFKFSGLLAVCIIIGIAAYAGYLYNKASAAIDQISLPEDKANLNQDQTSPYSISKDSNHAQNKPLTFLLTAVDERQGSEGSLNTDVLMLVSVNPLTHAATIVSIPRDLEIRPEDSGFDVSRKINYFYAYYYNKDKQTAILHTKEMFSKLFDVPIDYMAVINFDGFRQFIDRLGGMKVDVDMDMKYVDESDGTRIDLKKGPQILSGKQTLDYVRYRKSNRGTEESSDMARNERQQTVMAQLLDKLTSIQGIAGWGKLLDIAGQSVKTDIPADQIRQFAGLYREWKPDTTEFIHLDGEWESPFIVVKEEDIQHAIRSLRSNLRPGV